MSFGKRLYPIMEHGTIFVFDNKKYQTVGIDGPALQIEAIAVPFDGNFYWFDILKNGKELRMII